MTRLLDTGYLETDEAVVQACFLGKQVKRWRAGRWVNDILGSIHIRHSLMRVSAHTVAEVWNAKPADIRYGTLLMVCGPTKMHDWLRKHVGESE